MMEPNQTQKTTTLIEIRDFLAANQVQVQPWCSSDSVVGALYDLLQSRRRDEAFWGTLEELVARLDDRRFDPTPLLGAETMSEGRIEQIVKDLRDSLGIEGSLQIPTWRAWLSRTTGIGALAAFLLLGSATGCLESDPESSTPPEVCVEAQAEGLDGQDGIEYCDLLNIVEEADIASHLRSRLLECLPYLDAEYRANLLDDFINMSDEDILRRLDSLAYTPPCYEDAH
jgi:hypothetical protein